MGHSDNSPSGQVSPQKSKRVLFMALLVRCIVTTGEVHITHTHTHKCPTAGSVGWSRLLGVDGVISHAWNNNAQTVPNNLGVMLSGENKP